MLIALLGENQHLVTTARLNGFPTEPSIFASATRSCLIAAGLTGAAALGGVAGPGLFVNCVAILGFIDLPHTAFLVYGRRELDVAVLKANNITPKPGKLWERTSHFTVDDGYLLGGALGVLAALNPRALPGVRGWKRIFGAATVGSALGAQVGWKYMERSFPQLDVPRSEAAHWRRKRAEYNEKLARNEKAKASLSWPGKTVLALNAMAGSRVGQFLERFGLAGFPGQSSHPNGAEHGPGDIEWQAVPQVSPAVRQLSKENQAFTIEVERSAVAGHDMGNGSRLYGDTLQDKNAEELQNHLDYLHKLKQKLGAEAKFLWQELASKERQFYGIVTEDYEKDIFRRQLQLLHSTIAQLVVRDTIITYHIVDARKQLGQIDSNDKNSHTAPAIADALESEIFIEPETTHSPEMTVRDLRLNWLRKKDRLAPVERVLKHHQADHADDPNTKEALALLNLEVENMRRNVEATERLLREFENHVRKAEVAAERQLGHDQNTAQ